MTLFKVELVREGLCALGFAIGCPEASSVAAVSQLEVNGDEVPFETWHTTIMPGQDLDWEAPWGVDVRIDGTQVDQWTAPNAAGIHQMTFHRRSRLLAEVSIFVLEPASNITSKGYLNGYRIGAYPKNAPTGFIRLDSKADYKTAISPAFRIGQFICKQQPNHFPKYLVVSKPNLERSESLLTSLREDGLTDAETFFVMSGFRTPFYNQSIGAAKFSRHMYGDAFDIYLDAAPRDGVMDDINKDGQVTKADANFLYDYAGELFAENADLPKGGLGAYGSNAVHGPFVHVDGRGRVARWGR